MQPLASGGLGKTVETDCARSTKDRFHSPPAQLIVTSITSPHGYAPVVGEAHATAVTEREE